MWHTWKTVEMHIKFRWGDILERNHLGDPGIDGRIILKFIFKKWGGEAWTGLISLRTGAGGGHL